MPQPKITIEKLDRPEYQGDWHDAPLKWKVVGPDTELQKFSTKKEATIYRRIRRKAKDWQEAHHAFVAHV